MVIDDGGAIWLSNPWLVSAVIAISVALVLWCHRWIETGKAPGPRSLGSQAVRMSRRRSRRQQAPVRPSLVARPSRLVTRPVAASRMRRTAA
jgi:hypothetical protein